MPPTKPNLIIHGGAGNITPQNFPPEVWAPYAATLLRVYRSSAALLEKGATALDAATHAVREMEDWEGFNCGRGAVSLLGPLCLLEEGGPGLLAQRECKREESGKRLTRVFVGREIGVYDGGDGGVGSFCE